MHAILFRIVRGAIGPSPQGGQRRTCAVPTILSSARNGGYASLAHPTKLRRGSRKRNRDVARAAQQRDGQISKTCPAFLQKISPLPPSGKSSLQACPIPPHQEGRIMIVTNVGRDAVDAMARD